MIFEKIYENIYRINVSLPNIFLHTLNAYLIKGEERNLLIDNGFNISETEEELRDALKALSVNLETTDFFLTHHHSDHTGLTSRFLTHGSSKLYCSKQSGELLNQLDSDTYWKDIIFGMKKHGFPSEELQGIYKKYTGRLYAAKGPFPFSWVNDNDLIDVGRYRFRVVATPGHSLGHMTLFEEKLGIYICGDHILAGTIPNITYSTKAKDPLSVYMASLDISASLDPSISLPGHYGIIENTRDRITEIKKHYEIRLSETQSILKLSGPLQAYTLASRMRWSMSTASWNTFSDIQRWFSTEEALILLEHFEAIGKVFRIEDPKTETTLFSYI